nr:hypothetical protein [Tanacetum cinerariifolium]
MVTSSGNIPKETNRPLLSSTGVNPSTSASRTKPSGNTKNDRISQTPISNEKNNIEVQSRKLRSSLNKWNSDSKNAYNEHVKHPVKGYTMWKDLVTISSLLGQHISPKICSENSSAKWYGQKMKPYSCGSCLDDANLLKGSDVSMGRSVVAESTIIEDNPFAHADNDPFLNVFASKPSSEASSSGDASSASCTHVTRPHNHLGK